MTNNQLLTLHVRRSGQVWIFTDPNTGLVDEPLIAGVPEIINLFVDREDKEASLIFSLQEFPDSKLISFDKKEHGGAWYKYNNNGKIMKGWLCPALYKYFDSPPMNIFFNVQKFY